MTAPLPPEVPVRRVVGTDITDNGAGIIGTLTFTAQPAELIARTAKTSIFTQPKTVPVTAGAFTADLIAYDGATVDAGLGGKPWAYQVIRSWQPRNPFYIVVPQGPLGTTADPSLDISGLIVPSPPASVAVVKGDKGDSGLGSVAYDTDGVPYLLPAPSGASKRLVTEASPLLASKASKAASNAFQIPGKTGFVGIEADGDAGIFSGTAESDAANGQMRFRLSRATPDLSGAKDFLISSYGYGVLTEFGGTEQHSVGVFAVNSPPSPFPNYGGRLWVSNDHDTGGMAATSRIRVLNNGTDGVVTGGTTLASASKGFAVADVGNYIIVGAVETTILAWVDIHTVTLAAPATNGTGVSFGWVQGAGAFNGAMYSEVASQAFPSFTGGSNGPLRLRAVGASDAVEVWHGVENAAVRNLQFGPIGPAGESGIAFGPAADVHLYRTSTGAIQFDVGLIAQSDVTIAPNTGVASLVIKSAGTTGNQNEAITFQDGAASKWQIQSDQFGEIFIFDVAHGRIHTNFIAGANATASVLDVGASLKVEGNVGFYNTAPVAKPTVTGAKATNAALTSLIVALVSQGLITDTTTA